MGRGPRAGEGSEQPNSEILIASGLATLASRLQILLDGSQMQKKFDHAANRRPHAEFYLGYYHSFFITLSAPSLDSLINPLHGDVVLKLSSDNMRRIRVS